MKYSAVQSVTKLFIKDLGGAIKLSAARGDNRFFADSRHLRLGRELLFNLAKNSRSRIPEFLRSYQSALTVCLDYVAPPRQDGFGLWQGLSQAFDWPSSTVTFHILLDGIRDYANDFQSRPNGAHYFFRFILSKDPYPDPADPVHNDKSKQDILQDIWSFYFWNFVFDTATGRLFDIQPKVEFFLEDELDLNAELQSFKSPLAKVGGEWFKASFMRRPKSPSQICPCLGRGD